jgi:hypothetical protein
MDQSKLIGGGLMQFRVSHPSLSVYYADLQRDRLIGPYRPIAISKNRLIVECIGNLGKHTQGRNQETEGKYHSFHDCRH